MYWVCEVAVPMARNASDSRSPARSLHASGILSSPLSRTTHPWDVRRARRLLISFCRSLHVDDDDDVMYYYKAQLAVTNFGPRHTTHFVLRGGSKHRLRASFLTLVANVSGGFKAAYKPHQPTYLAWPRHLDCYARASQFDARDGRDRLPLPGTTNTNVMKSSQDSWKSIWRLFPLLLSPVRYAFPLVTSCPLVSPPASGTVLRPPRVGGHLMRAPDAAVVYLGCNP